MLLLLLLLLRLTARPVSAGEGCLQQQMLLRLLVPLPLLLLLPLLLQTDWRRTA